MKTEYIKIKANSKCIIIVNNNKWKLILEFILFIVSVDVGHFILHADIHLKLIFNVNYSFNNTVKCNL